MPNFPFLLTSLYSAHTIIITALTVSLLKENMPHLWIHTPSTIAGISTGPNICWIVFGPMLVQGIWKLDGNLSPLTFKCDAFSIHLDKGELEFSSSLYANSSMFFTEQVSFKSVFKSTSYLEQTKWHFKHNIHPKS